MFLQLSIGFAVLKVSAECRTMMDKKQEMQNELHRMDATLNELVAEMNATKTSKEADAMEKPIAGGPDRTRCPG